MCLQSYHRIIAYDGGSDWLRPARWIARPDPGWFEPSLRLHAYGRTRERAVAAVRLKLRRRYPNAPWFAGVPAGEDA
jgi:hypothetical protein